MPNWCNNHVTLTHKDPAMIQRAYDALERGEFLNEFIPVPEDLKITSGFLGSGPEQEELERKTAENVKNHGYGNWYDFSCGEWGTKWDTGEQGNNDINPNDPCMLTAGFDTAWSPPVRAYEKLSELGFIVNAMYYESGMAYCGTWTTEDGDEEFNLEGMSADQVANELPVELDECFGISECIAEYEAENEEELTAWIKDGADKKAQLIAE
jgi:hypothetical protein